MTTPLWKQQKLEREARQARLREYYAIHRPHVVKDLGVNFSDEVNEKKNNEAKLLSLVQHMNTSASLVDSATKVTTLLPRANKNALPHEDETSKGYSAMSFFLIGLVVSAAVLHATQKRSRRPSSWERYRATRRYYERLHAQQRKKQVKVAIAVAAILFILSPLLIFHAIGIHKHER